MKKFFALLLTALLLLSCTACTSAKIEDTNGPDNFELNTITDQNILKLDLPSSGHGYKTGGLLAKRITEIPGASEVFRGGTVVYTEEAKCELLGIKPEFIEENGVVSAAVAVKMAKKVRKKLGATFGIGITGWAGPDGDDVGVVYVALACKGESFVRRVNAGKRSRGYIRQVSVTNAFDMLRRYLTGLDV